MSLEPRSDHSQQLKRTNCPPEVSHSASFNSKDPLSLHRGADTFTASPAISTQRTGRFHFASLQTLVIFSSWDNCRTLAAKAVRAFGSPAFLFVPFGVKTLNQGLTRGNRSQSCGGQKGDPLRRRPVLALALLNGAPIDYFSDCWTPCTTCSVKRVRLVYRHCANILL